MSSQGKTGEKRRKRAPSGGSAGKHTPPPILDPPPLLWDAVPEAKPYSLLARDPASPDPILAMAIKKRRDAHVRARIDHAAYGMTLAQGAFTRRGFVDGKECHVLLVDLLLQSLVRPGIAFVKVDGESIWSLVLHFTNPEVILRLRRGDTRQALTTRPVSNMADPDGPLLHPIEAILAGEGDEMEKGRAIAAYFDKVDTRPPPLAGILKVPDYKAILRCCLPGRKEVASIWGVETTNSIFSD